MAREYRVLTFDGEPTHRTERDAERRAQALADEHGCTVWYETDAGEAECVPSDWPTDEQLEAGDY